MVMTIGNTRRIIALGLIILFSALLTVYGCGSSGSQSTGYPTITASLLDENGDPTTTISDENPGTLRITVTGASTDYIEVSTSKGAFQGSDGTALLDSNNTAELTLIADGDTGAGTIDVTVYYYEDADVEDAELSAYTEESVLEFQIGAPEEIALGVFIDDIFYEGELDTTLPDGTALSVGGQTTIYADLAVFNEETDAWEPYEEQVDVTFSSLCDGGELGDPNWMGDGRTTISYSAGTCQSATDTITASVEVVGSVLSASLTIDLAAPEAGSIEFVSITDSSDNEIQTISLQQGTASSEAPQSANVTFLVKDEIGNPMSGVQVDFSLTTTIGGLSITPSSADTDGDGYVTVTVNSGNVPTQVRVTATVNNTQISTVSDRLVVSTGLPDQNSFSMSIETFNPLAWNVDGVEVDVTIRAADHFNNPVPDGTTIYFTTEGGNIDPSCQTTDGACTVQWESSNPRPEGIGHESRDGRSTILAHAVGEETFTDLNGSGLYEESSDTFEDLPEAFLDVDEDGVYDSGFEEFFDFDEDWDYDDGNNMFNGILCSEGDCTDELVHVRDDGLIVMASCPYRIETSCSSIQFDYEGQGGYVYVTIYDVNDNSTPAGTTITVTPPDNAEIVGDSSYEVTETETEPNTFGFYLQSTDGDTTDFLEIKVESTYENTTCTPLSELITVERTWVPDEED